MRANWTKIALGAGVVIVVWFTIGIILAGRENTPPPPGSQSTFIKNCRIHGNRISTRSFSFSCKNAELSPDGTIATINGVRDGVLYKKGKPYLGIAAEHVSLNTQTFDFTAIGDVHLDYLKPKDGVHRSFDTDLVQWTNATKLLSLQHPSLVRTGDQTLKVATITVDFNNNEIHLGKIEGSVQAPNP